MSDPFTDFMTGQLSERHAAEDRRVFALSTSASLDSLPWHLPACLSERPSACGEP